MPRPRFRTRVELLRDLSESLRAAVAAASPEQLDAHVAAMSPAEMEEAYAELDRLRAATTLVIEAVMVRRRAVAAADALERELSGATGEERAEILARLKEHQALLDSLR